MANIQLRTPSFDGAMKCKFLTYYILKNIWRSGKVSASDDKVGGFT